MKTEIEFRGKDIKTNKWVYGYYFVENHLGVLKECIMYYKRLLGEDTYVEVKSGTVGQYIGHSDMYENKLYVGCVIIIPTTYCDGNVYDQCIAEIRFEDGKFIAVNLGTDDGIVRQEFTWNETEKITD